MVIVLVNKWTNLRDPLLLAGRVLYLAVLFVDLNRPEIVGAAVVLVTILGTLQVVRAARKFLPGHIPRHKISLECFIPASTSLSKVLILSLLVIRRQVHF